MLRVDKTGRSYSHTHSSAQHPLQTIPPSTHPQCFRLYTRSYFERKMPDTTPPEICRTSLSGAVLQLKALNLPGLDVLSFGFLDPPDQVGVCLCCVCCVCMCVVGGPVTHIV